MVYLRVHYEATGKELKAICPCCTAPSGGKEATGKELKGRAVAEPGAYASSRYEATGKELKGASRSGTGSLPSWCSKQLGKN